MRGKYWSYLLADILVVIQIQYQAELFHRLSFETSKNFIIIIDRTCWQTVALYVTNMCMYTCFRRVPERWRCPFMYVSIHLSIPVLTPYCMLFRVAEVGHGIAGREGKPSVEACLIHAIHKYQRSIWDSCEMRGNLRGPLTFIHFANLWGGGGGGGGGVSQLKLLTKRPRV